VCSSDLSVLIATGFSTGLLMLCLILLGSGSGMVNPGLLIATQNAVRHKDLGAASATSAYFRSLGGALGIAIAGVILVRMASDLSVRLTVSGEGPLRIDLDSLHRLSASARVIAASSYSGAIAVIMRISAGVALTGAVVLLFFLREIPLRTSRAYDIEEAAHE
jgi:hypothetical protein